MVGCSSFSVFVFHFFTGRIPMFGFSTVLFHGSFMWWSARAVVHMDATEWTPWSKFDVVVRCYCSLLVLSSCYVVLV